MQRPLPKCIIFLAMFLAVPALCLAWTAELRPESREFNQEPEFSDSMRNSDGGSFQNVPATAVNIPTPSQKAPAVPKPLYPPNAAGDPRAAETVKASLGNILSFLLPTKDDLEKSFKAEDQAFLERGRSTSDPFRKRDWK